MPRAPQDQTSPDDILELSDLVDDKDGRSIGLDADSVDMTFEQELEELFSEDLAADDDRLDPVPSAGAGPMQKSVPHPPTAKAREEAPLILDDLAEEDDALLLEDLVGNDSGENGLVDDMPMILDDLAEEEALSTPAPTQKSRASFSEEEAGDDDIDLLLDEVTLADEPDQEEEESALDLSDLTELGDEEEEILDLGDMLADDDPLEPDVPLELSLDDALEDVPADTPEDAPHAPDNAAPRAAARGGFDSDLSGNLDELLADGNHDLEPAEDELLLGEELLLDDLAHAETETPAAAKSGQPDPDGLDAFVLDGLELDEEPAPTPAISTEEPLDAEEPLDLDEFALNDELDDVADLDDALDIGAFELDALSASSLAATDEDEFAASADQDSSLDLDGLDFDGLLDETSNSDPAELAPAAPVFPVARPLAAKTETPGKTILDDSLLPDKPLAAESSAFDFAEQFPGDADSEDIEALLDGVEIDVSDLDEDLPPLDGPLDDLDDDLAPVLDVDSDKNFAAPLDTDMSVVMDGEDDADGEAPLSVNVDTLLGEIEAEGLQPPSCGEADTEVLTRIASLEQRLSKLTSTTPESSADSPSDLHARLDSLEKRLDGLEALLREEVARTVPSEAARIIREEIQALVDDLGD
ncbi:MAG: hypothetical protein AB7E32_03440 [Desulfovibrio sp.]